MSKSFPIVERVSYSGAWVVSDIVGGYLVTRTYYGYTRVESLRLFVDEMSHV